MCGAKHPRYSKVFCLRDEPCGYGTPHLARGPRGYWVSWDDEKTKITDFWEMIQKLTNRAKVRQQQDDKERGFRVHLRQRHSRSSSH